jgi:outer membrane protein assembly factor BamB
MDTPRQQAATGSPPVGEFHVHVETGRGSGALTAVLVVPERPVGALSAALERLHAADGPADLDARLGGLAGAAPADTAFAVGVGDQVWVLPSEAIAVRRRTGDHEEIVPEPQVLRLGEGDRVELAESDTGAVLATLRQGDLPVTAPPVVAAEPSPPVGAPPAVAPEPSPPFAAPAPKAPRPRRRLVVPVGILAAMGVALVIGVLRGRGPAPEPRADALIPPDSAPVADRVPAEVVVDEMSVPAPEAVAGEPSWLFHAAGAISSSPLVVGDRILFGCRDSTLYCLDARSGEVEWKLAAGSGIGSSPRESGGSAFVGTYGGELLAVALDDGEPRWKAVTGGRIVSSPCVVDDRVIVGSYDRAIHGFDRKSGERRWKVDAGTTVRASAERVGPDGVVIGAGDGTLFCLDAGSGDVRWRRPTDAAIFAACAFDPARDLIVAGTQNGSAYGVSARTGEVRWRTSLGAEINGQPRFAGDVVLVGTGQGRLTALDPDTGSLQWTAEAGRGFDATPVVIGSTVVAPSFDGIVHFLDLADGGVRDRRPLEEEVFSSPTAGQGFLYVATMGGTLHALPLP